MKRLLIVPVVVSIIIFSGCAGETGQTQDTEKTAYNPEISANEAEQKFNDPKMIILDVRNEDEYLEQHVNNAILIPLDRLASEINDQTQISKDSEIVVYCRSGRRSAEAVQILANLGYNNVRSMAGGIIAWNQAGNKVCKNTEKTC